MTMKVQTNLRDEVVTRLTTCLATGETIAGFVAAAVKREIARRERGGKVEVEARRGGRPKKVESE